MRETREKKVCCKEKREQTRRSQRAKQKKSKNKCVSSVKVLQDVEWRPSSPCAHIQKHPHAKQVMRFHFLSPAFTSLHPRYRTSRFLTCEHAASILAHPHPHPHPHPYPHTPMHTETWKKISSSSEGSVKGNVDSPHFISTCPKMQATIAPSVFFRSSVMSPAFAMSPAFHI